MTRHSIVMASILCCIPVLELAAQEDTVQTKVLQSITIASDRFSVSGVQPLPSIKENFIYSGKKTEVFSLDTLPVNIVEKTGRQVFARIPGVFVYDMDGAGNQINIAMRGLDPHRSWEINMRQNGIMINSDIYGYPASHYNPPLESIERIEIVRGTAALQYGAQFGGMVNYITKKHNANQKFAYESISAIGSFNTISSFHSFGGKAGQLSFYMYVQKRQADGYRHQARSSSEAQFISLQYNVSRMLKVRAELARSQYLYRIPGPLNDLMFHQNPRQATRTRNYYEPDVWLPSITFDWQAGKRTYIEWTTSALIGARNSVQFIGFATVKDTINPQTMRFAPRQVDIDLFNSYTSEWRIRHDYEIGKKPATIVGGIRYINNRLHRRQQGEGTSGSDYDLSVVQPFKRDVYLKTQNIAVFVENKLLVGSSAEISAGLRLENGISRMRGKIAYLPEERIPFDLSHRFLLAGISGQYHFNAQWQLYGGWAQAYRPVIFADLVPANPLERNNPDLKDASGYNAEIGLRGGNNRWRVDMTLFQLLYRNRVGSLQMTDTDGSLYIWKTNIGNSKNTGIEIYAEYQLLGRRQFHLSIFTASAWQEAFYLNGSLRRQNQNVELTGNRLEGVPRLILRNGLQGRFKQWESLLLFSYTDKNYSDPFNTKEPSATGAAGIVPAYKVWDWNFGVKISNKCRLLLTINNLTNEQYFTKRPVIYPGAGVWPSDGRSWILTVKVRL